MEKDTLNNKNEEDIFIVNEWIKLQIKNLNNQPSLKEVIESKKNTPVYYQDLLKCFEWKYKRLIVLLRDRYECYDCNTVNAKNHIHHTYYIKNRLPWDIEDSALITLCDKCHFKRHEKEEILVYEIKNNQRIITNKQDFRCYRCNGTGYLPEYYYVEDGVCFRCGGIGTIGTVFSDILDKIDLSSYHDSQLRNNYSNALRSINDTEKINIVNRISFHAHMKIHSSVAPPSPEESAFIDAKMREAIVKRMKASGKQSSHDEL